jgi:hypothetical protein
VIDQSIGQPRLVEAPPEPVRCVLGESEEAYRQRLCSVVAAAWDWAQLSKPDGHLRPQLTPPPRAKTCDFVKGLPLGGGPAYRVTVIRSEIAYFLVGHRWRLSPEGVRSALRDGRKDDLSR